MQKNSGERPHRLELSDRSRLSVTGVEDVQCFNEELAVISTAMGEMTVTGAELKVSELDLATGNVTLQGRVDSIEYGGMRRGGLLARIFK